MEFVRDLLDAVLTPLTEQDTFMGAHVSRAARIEPVTPPGNVYASSAFAALAATEKVREFVCEYRGRVPLAKEFGNHPLYHVLRGTGVQKNRSA